DAVARVGVHRVERGVHGEGMAAQPEPRGERSQKREHRRTPAQGLYACPCRATPGRADAALDGWTGSADPASGRIDATSVRRACPPTWHTRCTDVRNQNSRRSITET